MFNRETLFFYSQTQKRFWKLKEKNNLSKSSFLSKKTTLSYTSKYLKREYKLANSIPDSDLKSEIEKLIYKDFDNSEKYVFTFSEVSKNETEKTFETFIKKENEISENIFYFPLEKLFRNLFKNQKERILFLFFGEELNLTIFKNGEIEQTEKIDFSIKNIPKNRIEFTKSLKPFFENLSKYSENIDTIFYISESHETLGFSEYSSIFFKINSHHTLKKIFKIEKDESSFEKLLFLNFTTSSENDVFKREKESFTESKIFLSLLFLVTIFSLSFPTLYFSELEEKQKELQKVLNNFSKIKRENYEKFSTVLKLREEERDADFYIEKFESEKKQALKKLSNLEKFKNRYSAKSIKIAKISERMIQNRVFTEKIIYSKGNFHISLFSENSKNILNLIGDLSKEFKLSYNSIEFLENRKIFTTQLKISE
jgi:hypothetical protein